MCINNNNIIHTCLYTKEGFFLRSSREINFYELLKKNDINFEVERYYPGTKKFKCDFYLTDYELWIELCGMSSEGYLQKMQMKKEKYGAILLYDFDDQYDFIDVLKKKEYHECNY